MEELLVPSSNFNDIRLVSKITSSNLLGWWNGQSSDNQSFLIKLVLKSDICDSQKRIEFARLTSKWKQISATHDSSFFELSQDSFTYYLITKKPEGLSLTDYVSFYGTLNEDQFFTFAAELAAEFADYSEKGQTELILTTDQVFLDKNGNFLSIIPFTLQHKPDQKYYPPEIYTSQWVSSSATWNLGIILYYAYVGSYPFIGDSNESLKKSILTNSLVFPSGTEEKTKQMISQLLIKNFLLRDPISKISDSIRSSSKTKPSKKKSILKNIKQTIGPNFDYEQPLTLSKRIRKLNSSDDVEVIAARLYRNKRYTLQYKPNSLLIPCCGPIQILSRK